MSLASSQRAGPTDPSSKGGHGDGATANPNICCVNTTRCWLSDNFIGSERYLRGGNEQGLQVISPKCAT